MPQWNVTGPDGQKYRITAPEGATEDEANQQFNQFIGARQPAAPPEGFLGGLEEGAAGPIVGAGQIGEGLVDAVIPGASAAVKRALPGVAAKAHALKEATTAPSTSTAQSIGRAVGGIGATAPLMLFGGGLPALAAEGMAAGALQPTQSGSLRSHGVGGLEGGVAGMVPAGAGAAISRLARTPYFGHALTHLAASSLLTALASAAGGALGKGHLESAFFGWPAYFALRNSPLVHAAERAGVGATRGVGKALRAVPSVPEAAVTGQIHGEDNGDQQ